MTTQRKRSETKTPEPSTPARVDSGAEHKSTPEQNPVWQTLALRPAGIQTRLAISQPGERDEQEADFVADRLMRTANPQVTGSTPSASANFQSHKNAPRETHEETLQSKGQGSDADSSANDSAKVSETLNSQGEPLDSLTRTFMEERFGEDFSQVQVHTNDDAAASAQAVNALAYTVGQDVVFGAGQYAPNTIDGRQLLAHELAHVIQQSEGSTRIQRQQPGAGQQQAPPQQPQQQPNLMKIYSFGPTGAGRYAHDAGTTIFPPAAPVDANGNELVRAGTTAEPILSRFGRAFQLDERERPLTPPVPSATIRFQTEWVADDGSENRVTNQSVTGTYYGPGQTLGSSLGSEYIFRNDRPGVLTLAYILSYPGLLFIILSHGVHYVNSPAASPGATVLPDHVPNAAPPAASDEPP